MDQNVRVRYVFTVFELDHICKHHNAFLMTLLLYVELLALFISIYLILHILLHMYLLSIQYDYRYGLIANG